MKKNSVINYLIIFAAIALAVYFMIPTFVFYSKSPEQRAIYLRDNPQVMKKILNLGLDLQGGMRLVLEIDRSKLEKGDDKDVLDRAFTIIENRINALGVAEPSIQKQGNDRLIIELPGLKDEGAAKGVIGRTAQLEFNLLREPAQLERAISVVDNVVAGKLEKITDSTATDSAKIKAEENQQLAEKLFTGTEGDSAKAETAAKTESPIVKEKTFKEYLVQIGDQIGVRIDEIGKVDELLVREDVHQAIERAGLGGNKFLWAHDTTQIQGSVYRVLYYVKSSPEMRGDIISDARATMDQMGMQAGGAKVDMEMNSKGARRFSSVTAANVNKFMAIVLDNSVYSAPRIIQKISGGKAEITGSFSLEEAKNLAIVLRAGALPAPVKIIEERTVGPSLGQDSIEKGMIAGAVGTLLVMIFMMVYYRVSGAIAILAQILNIFIVLAVMAGVNATLTLPGIAGMILLIGMGVDANVIIFERIREELALGKTNRSAISSGFSIALNAILDSNITTIITSAILIWKGTGAIRGFAITLIFGLVASLFTALFVSRVMMDSIFIDSKKQLSI